MKVKALTSFSGELSMYVGEEREIEKGEVLTDLLNAHYVEEIKTTKADKKGVKADENK